jgi:hypothetical protein
VTSNDFGDIDAATEPEASADSTPEHRPSRGRAGAAWFRRHGRIARGLVVIAVAAIVGTAYVVGGPPIAFGQTASLDARTAAGPADIQFGAQSKSLGTQTLGVGPAGDTTGAAAGTNSGISPEAANGVSTTDPQSAVLAAAESNQIVKTGQLDLVVSDIDAAVGDAQKAIVGLGGSVDASNASGSGNDATASITYRVPAAKWDEAIADLRKIGSKVLSLQTTATDVTTQVIDLDARIDNLQKTEAALQSIMTRATAVADVLAVENQLSQTEGQIEELTAERDHLKDQAAMSTLTVSFQLPTSTITSQATQDWTLGAQVDQAGAALVRVGQGLVTIVVWICVVALPLALAALLLYAIAALIRRILRRGRRGSTAVAA